MPHHLTDDGCRIHFVQTGEGPDCVLIPGLGGDGGFWRGVADQLSKRHRLLIVDHRGAGASDRPATGYSIPRIAADVLGIVDQLGLRQVPLVGHSTGSMLVQTIATTAPGRISSMVLSGGWARRDLRFRRMFEARLALLKDGGPVAYHKLTQALGYDAAWMERNRDMLDAELSSAPERLSPLDVQAQRIAMLLEHDVHEALPDIAIPTLVIGAEDDALIPFSASQELAGLIPGARLERLTGGHFFPRSYPEPYAALVAAFLKEHGE